jgi:hypothetical protein
VTGLDALVAGMAERLLGGDPIELPALGRIYRISAVSGEPS